MPRITKVHGCATGAGPEPPLPPPHPARSGPSHLGERWACRDCRQETAVAARSCQGTVGPLPATTPTGGSSLFAPATPPTGSQRLCCLRASRCRWVRAQAGKRQLADLLAGSCPAGQSCRAGRSRHRCVRREALHCTEWGLCGLAPSCTTRARQAQTRHGSALPRLPRLPSCAAVCLTGTARWGWPRHVSVPPCGPA